MSNLIFLARSNTVPYALQLDKQLHGYYTLQFVCQGSLVVCYDDQVFVLDDRPGGWFFPAYPGPRLRFHPLAPEGTWWHRHLGFQGELVAEWHRTGLWPTEPQPCPDSVAGAERLDAIFSVLQEQTPWHKQRAINLLEALLLDLAEARSPSVSPSAWLEAVRARLGDQFTPDYGKIATELGCSLATLRRRFRKELGQSLHEYVIGQRVARARALLLETDLSLHAVAEQLGYDSVFFFSRQFKQQAGVTPGEYRRSRLFIPPSGR